MNDLEREIARLEHGRALMLLLHYYCGGGGTFRGLDPETTDIAWVYLIEAGMVLAERHELTDKGAFFVNFLLDIPLPVVRFEVPGFDVPGKSESGG